MFPLTGVSVLIEQSKFGFSSIYWSLLFGIPFLAEAHVRIVLVIVDFNIEWVVVFDHLPDIIL